MNKIPPAMYSFCCDKLNSAQNQRPKCPIYDIKLQKWGEKSKMKPKIYFLECRIKHWLISAGIVIPLSPKPHAYQSYAKCYISLHCEKQCPWGPILKKKLCLFNKIVPLRQSAPHQNQNSDPPTMHNSLISIQNSQRSDGYHINGNHEFYLVGQGTIPSKRLKMVDLYPFAGTILRTIKLGHHFGKL